MRIETSTPAPVPARPNIQIELEWEEARMLKRILECARSSNFNASDNMARVANHVDGSGDIPKDFTCKMLAKNLTIALSDIDVYW